ncbi:MAG: hypothetical protein IEMM0006_2246 [bacterium]|nr:MAG: hypothetical protein IEMM0006_2246 [bacterium]
MKFRIYWLLLFLFLGLMACKKPVNPPKDTFIRGADLSKLPELEEEEAVYYNRKGMAENALDIFKSAGLNTVRLRLWVHPSGVHSSLQEVAAFSKRIHKDGLKVWLDLHYSDTWADPGHQTKPPAWKNLNLQQLEDSVYAYTLHVVKVIQPEYVQIGNEINQGFLWNDGRLSHPVQFTTLLKKGIAAAREANPSIRIILHYAGYKGADWFFGLIEQYHVDYDIIGLSYYPWWHGKSLDTLQLTLNQLSEKYQKKVVIAETAYPFTLSWNDWTNNFIGNIDQLIPGYPATEAGQEAFLWQLRTILQSIKNGGGFCYWEPEWVSIKGPQSTVGSPWENLALFDFQNKTLPAMSVFRP